MLSICATAAPLHTAQRSAHMLNYPQALAKLREVWARVEFVFTPHNGGAAGGKQVRTVDITPSRARDKLPSHSSRCPTLQPCLACRFRL